MRNCFAILIALSLVACSSGADDPVDPCNPNPCTEAHRGLCSANGDQAVCDCEGGYTFDGDQCVLITTDPCDPNPCNDEHKTVCTDVDGQAVCSCDENYTLEGESCVPLLGDPCDPNPCDLPNRSVCVNDDGQARCDCDEGFIDSEGQCLAESSDECPAGHRCRADVCVPFDLSEEQCLTDADCHTEDPAAPTLCNAAAAGGICLGCADDLDCPGATVCNDFGSCALICDDDEDCPHGSCYTGFCGQAICFSQEDCPFATTCIDEDEDGRGMCMRIPCVEVDCSPTKPDGLCPTGSLCIAGACADSCDPNPCGGELNRNTCELDEDLLPHCVCDEGFEEDAEGACVPAACPLGYECDNGVCADRSQPAFQCGSDTDCGPGMTCSNSVPGGTCNGCDDTHECALGFQCLAGYCLRLCDEQADCHPGTTCGGTYCSKISCTGADGECPTGTTCLDTGSELLCRAVPCD